MAFNTNNSALSIFALRLVNSKIDHGKSNADDEPPTEAEANMQAHIVGIFVSLDTDRDGLITRPQLLQGVQLLGLRPNKVLLNNFAVPERRVSSTGAQQLMSAEEKIKQSKIDAATFCRVMFNEWKRVKSTIPRSLDAIMLFARDDDLTGAGLRDDHILSIAAIKHLMQGVEVPSKLSDKDFLAFTELLPREDACGGVKVGNLKKVLFGI